MSQGWSAQGEVSQALRTVIADFGSQVLGNPDMLGNLLKDHIPDHPREINVLQAAALSGAAAAVDDRIRSGMAPAAAVRMTAVELTNSLAIDPAAAEWGVAEFAQALGYTIEPSSATLPQPDFTKQTAAQPRDQQFGATIAAPIPPYAGQPPPGYPAQQQFYAPPQPPADRTKSRGRLIIVASAVAVVVIGFFSYLGISPGPTPAQCLVGSWQAQSGYQTIASGSASGTWRITGGTEIWTYGPAGTGRVSDSGFAMTNHARSLVNELNDAGTFNYRVVGHEIEYHSVHVPGTLTQDNLATSKQHTYSYKTIYNDAPDQFSCSGSTLRRYGTAPGVIYSTTYKRQ